MAGAQQSLHPAGETRAGLAIITEIIIIEIITITESLVLLCSPCAVQPWGFLRVGAASLQPGELLVLRGRAGEQLTAVCLHQ